MIGLRDWSQAYYVVGEQKPEDNPVAAWDSTRKRYRLWTCSVLNMGNKFTVQSWCRVAELTMCICAREGRIVAPIYIDDAIIFWAGQGLREAVGFFEALSEFFGLELSDKPAAAIHPGNGPSENYWTPLHLGWHALRALPHNLRPRRPTS